MTTLGFLGAVLMFIGWMWLIVIGYKKGGALWAVLIVFFSLIAGLAFCITKKEGWLQWTMLVVGWLVVMFGGGITSVNPTN